MKVERREAAFLWREVECSSAVRRFGGSDVPLSWSDGCFAEMQWDGLVAVMFHSPRQKAALRRCSGAERLRCGGRAK